LTNKTDIRRCVLVAAQLCPQLQVAATITENICQTPVERENHDNYPNGLKQSYRPIDQLIPTAWQQTAIVANGIHQHLLRTGGDKPPLLLLHGFMESGVSWLGVAKGLPERYDVIIPDARVHGRSAGGETGFSPKILAEDASALLAALKVDRPILFGRSNGALTAFLLAARPPE
jgi:alpha/beta hydrolase fold